jgi:hypothetical protein
MSISVSDLSTVYIKSRIRATKNGATYDPTGDVVEVAFKTPGVDPAGPDWHAASWEAASSSVFYARLLVGPVGGLVLTVGTYKMWIRITDAPEVPVLEAPGTVRIY